MKTDKKIFTSANILRAEVGTTGPQGGDAGHGGRTYLKLTDEGNTAWKAVVLDGDGETPIDQPKSITITVQGDAELETFAASLEWAAQRIKQLARS